MPAPSADLKIGSVNMSDQWLEKLLLIEKLPYALYQNSELV